MAPDGSGVRAAAYPGARVWSALEESKVLMYGTLSVKLETTGASYLMSPLKRLPVLAFCFPGAWC